jgi:hypothetical protein
MAKAARRKPPIQNIENIDVVGRRKDGGVDLMIVTSSHLDESKETQKLLLDKIESYLEQLNTPEFQEEFDHPSPEQVRIVIDCDQRPSDVIMELLRRSRDWVKENNATLAMKLNTKD